MYKYRKLFLGIVFDAIGYVSYLFPGIGEFIDIVWAPLSGWLMTRMYRGKAGKVAGIVTFVEEALPGVDFIPSFTLMWLYTFVLNKKETIIEVE